MAEKDLTSARWFARFLVTDLILDLALHPENKGSMFTWDGFAISAALMAKAHYPANCEDWDKLSVRQREKLLTVVFETGLQTAQACISRHHLTSTKEP